MVTDAQREAFDYFRSVGWSEAAAAGIVGNLVNESGQNLDPTLSHDNGTGFGIAGHRDPRPGVGRWTNLKRFAAERGLDVRDRMTQLQFIHHELQTDYAHVGRRLRSASDPAEAAGIFIDFEQPGGWSAKAPWKGNGYDNRRNDAVKIFSELTGKPAGVVRSAAAAPAGLYDTADGGTGPYGQGAIFSDVSPALPDPTAPPSPDKDQYGLWDYTKATAKEDMTAYWLYQRMEAGDVPYDPTWRPTEQGLKDWQTRYSLPDRYLGEIGYAGSQAELDRLGELFQESMKREEILSEFGVPGSIGRLVTTIVDPVAIGATAVSEGALAPLVLGTKLGKIGRIAGRMALDGGMLAGETAIGAAVSPNIDSTDVAVAFGIGAVLGGTVGAIGRNPALKDEARALTTGGQKLMQAEPGAGAVGAARNPDAPEFLGTSTPHVLEGDAPKAAFGSVRFDSVGKLGSSENPLTRTVGAHFGEEVVGFTDKNLVVPHSAEARKLELSRAERGRWYSVVEPAFDEWMADMKYPWFEKDSRRLEFMEQVSAAAEDRVNGHLYHPAVQKAAKANQEGYARFVDYLTNPGILDGSTRRAVDGFDSLVKDRFYVPKYMDPARLAAIGSKFSRDVVERFIADAFQARLPELTNEAARRIAKGYYTNISRAAIGMGDEFDRAFSSGSRERVEEILNDLEVKDEDRAELMKLLEPKEDGGASARSMRRSPIDYGHTALVRTRDGGFERLSVRDFFHRDAEWIFNRYVNELSGRVALARMQVRNPRTGELIVDGITSRADFDKVKDWIRDVWQDRGALGKADPRVKADLDNLQFLYDNLVGVPHYDRSGRAWQWARRLRDFNFARLMNNTGIYQAQEMLAVPFKVGFKAALQQMPGVAAVGRAMLDDRYVHKDLLTRELQIMGGQGAEEFLNAERLRLLDETVGESFGETKIDRLGRQADNVLMKAKQVTAKISFLHTLTATAQTWTMRATAQRFADIAKAGGKLSKGDRARMRQLGLSDEDITGVVREMRKHAGIEDGGGRLHTLNMAQWDPEVRAKFVTALFRWSRRVIQENDLGSTARWMTHPGAQVFLQFRNFVLNAYSKQFLHGLHNFDARTIIGIAGSAIAGGLGYATTEYVKSLGAEDKKAYLEGKLSIDRLLLGAVGRMPESSILPMLFDSTAGYVIGAQFGNTRASGQSSDIIFGNPTFGIIDEVGKFTTAVRRSIVEGRPMAQDELKSGYRLLPFANWLPAATLFSHLIQDRREHAPRPSTD